MKPRDLIAPVVTLWAWSAIATLFCVWWSFGTWQHCLSVGHDPFWPLVIVVAVCVPVWAAGAFVVLILTALSAGVRYASS